MQNVPTPPSLLSPFPIRTDLCIFCVALGASLADLCGRTSLATRDEEGFRHFICRPVSTLAQHLNTVTHVAYQQMAVLGIVVMILGFSPRKYPFQPSL